MPADFTVNSIALGNLRTRRRQYLFLIAGIVLAVYFTATALLFGAAMFTSLREQHYRRAGRQDAIIFNCREAPLEELVAGGVFSGYGTAAILGYVLPDGESEVNGFSVARFDSAALALAGKDIPEEGRLPEKAGEIALERSTLARLRLEAGLGDRIALTLLIPDGTGFLDTPVQKSFTLVGILADKLIYLDRRGSAAPAYRDYPAGVLAAEEPIPAGGRAVINCYGHFAGGAGPSYERLAAFCKAHDLMLDEHWPAVESTIYLPFRSEFGADDSPIIATSAFFMIIAVVLVLAACLGIVNAFSASLESRKRQIGLLRAVGATQRQVREIFGRETLLLSVFSIPPALALACLTVWGITAALGDRYIFRPHPLILAAVAAAGVLCVMAAAAIPLRKASRIPPMQAIRDAGLSRRMKRSRVQSRTLFDVPRLIARRSFTLYRNRHAAITAMLAVSIVLLSLVSFMAVPLLTEASWDYGADYVLRKQGHMIDWLMEYEFHRPGITEQDRLDAAALAGVKAVTGEKVLRVKILVDAVTPYVTGSSYSDFDYLSPEPQDGNPGLRRWREREYLDYLASKARYGYTQDYLSVDCCAIDAGVVEKLAPFVSTGTINLDHLNSGAEILLVAPAGYGIVREERDDGSVFTSIDYQLDPGTAYSAVYQNDIFRAGDTLTVSLLYSDSPEYFDDPWQLNEDGSRKLPDDAVRLDRTVTIGALLELSAGEKSLGSHFHSFFFPRVGDIITTTAGLRALGFDLPYSALAVTLAESPDAAMEEYYETNLALIASRTAGVDLVSYLAIARENREIAYGMLIAAGAVLLLFFAICASMIINALSARIRASKREIGTVRAVGASEREIVCSYLWQLLSIFAWGAVLGLAVSLALCGWMLAKEILPAGEPSLPLWQPLLFIALLFGLCWLSLRSRVGEIFKNSVVENIREL